MTGKLENAHQLLEDASFLLREVKEMLVHEPAGADTWFALGYALGAIDKAKALVGRDIDVQAASNKVTQPNPQETGPGDVHAAPPL